MLISLTLRESLKQNFGHVLALGFLPLGQGCSSATLDTVDWDQTCKLPENCKVISFVTRHEVCVKRLATLKGCVIEAHNLAENFHFSSDWSNF